MKTFYIRLDGSVIEDFEFIPPGVIISLRRNDQRLSGIWVRFDDRTMIEITGMQHEALRMGNLRK